MRELCNLFKINGTPILSPDSGITQSYKDVQSRDSGQDESGVTHRIVLRHKVGEWTFVYNNITEEEKNYMESLFPDDDDFEFECPDRRDSYTRAKCRACRSSYGISWSNATDGLWKNYKFTITER